MVLFEIDTTRFTIFELEGNAPRSVDADGISPRIESMQGMKVKTRNVHFLRPDRDVETIEPRENALVHFCVYFRPPALRPQLGESLALEGPDHTSNVSK
jgi:hypothetical protein